MEERACRVLEKLKELDIPYELREHPAVYTIAEMEALELEKDCEAAKNLFLRDAKGKRHFLVVLRHDRQANLTALAGRLGVNRLSFASEERLRDKLGLERGAVTPLSALNDTENAVEFILDEALRGCERLSLHPNVNTASVVLSCGGLIRYLEGCGKTPRWLDVT